MENAEKISIIRNTLPNLIFNNYKLITDGYEKTVIITEEKKVICFLNDVKNIKKYIQQINFLETLSQSTNAIIPTISYISNEYGFFICEYITGQRITPDLIAGNMTQAQYIGQLIGEFLKQLHSLPIEVYNIPSTFIRDVAVDMEDGKRILATCLKSEDYKQIEKFLNEYYDIVGEHNSECIVHGDFHYNNIYWDVECKKLGVLDFGESCVGDPAIDFMWFVRQMPQLFIKAVFNSYGIDENLINRSIMFDRLYGIYDMIENQKGDPRKPYFEKGYKRFFAYGCLT